MSMSLTLKLVHVHFAAGKLLSDGFINIDHLFLKSLIEALSGLDRDGFVFHGTAISTG